MSRNKNLNQLKNRSLLEARYFNVEIGIYYFFQFTILTTFLSCWLINLGVFLTGKKTITNFLNPFLVHLNNIIGTLEGHKKKKKNYGFHLE